MAQPCTEIACLPLHAGIGDIEDPTSEPGKIWQSALKTISAQPGHERTYWGPQVENPEIIQLHVVWSSIADHKTFMASPEYKPFSAALADLLSHPATIHHAHLAPHPATPIYTNPPTPVTEIVTFYFQSPLARDRQAAFDKTLAGFSERMAKKAECSTARAGGWMVEEEEVEHKTLGKCRAYVAAYGWASVEAHMKYRETKDFRQTIAGVRELVSGTEMHHVIFDRR